MTTGQEGALELWFLPSPAIPCPVLTTLIHEHQLTVTLRRGAYDFFHREYQPRQVRKLRLFDEHGRGVLEGSLFITSVQVLKLSEVTPDNLIGAGPYHDHLESITHDLIFLEGLAEEDPTVHLLSFNYIEHPQILISPALAA